MLRPLINTRLKPVDPVAADFNNDRLTACIDMLNNWPEKQYKGVQAGYTYWGQFLAHELDPRTDLEPIRTAVLDLDSLYGTGWNSSRIAVNQNTGEFLLGDTLPVRDSPAPSYDLLRNDLGVPLIPEYRNDENLIIAQFHVLMQRTHNAIIATLNAQGHACAGQAAFETARKILTGLFHRLVRGDYLVRVTQTAVYQDIFHNNNSYLDFNPAHPLPLEISQAALRFGHSQVREKYQLNDHLQTRLPLSEMFRYTHAGDMNSSICLPADHVIEWHHFFDLYNNGNSQDGNKIDPYIVQDMRATQNPDVIARNLKAGARAALCSGQTLAKWLLENFPALHTLGLRDDHGCKVQDSLNRLEQAGIRTNTPLWIYILLEAEAATGSGNQLGELGSLLLCETLRNAMTNTADYHDEAEDFCQLARLDIRKMTDLILFVINLEKETQQ